MITNSDMVINKKASKIKKLFIEIVLVGIVFFASIVSSSIILPEYLPFS